MILWLNTRNYLILKRMDFYNAKISELEKTGDNSDAKTFWQCLKSMDDIRKGEDVPSMSEENWLQYIHNLHSNESLTQRSKTFAMNYDKMNAMVNTLVL